MKSTLVALSLVLIFFTACNLKENGQSKKIEQKDTVYQMENVQKYTPEKSSDISDLVVFDRLKRELTLDYFRINFDLIEKEVIENTYDKSLMDTIFIFSNGVDTVNFYVSRPNTILNYAIIKSMDITLDANIKIGISKNEFEKKLNLINLSDSLYITDPEGSSQFLFLFRNDSLETITYENLYFG